MGCASERETSLTSARDKPGEDMTKIIVAKNMERKDKSATQEEKVKNEIIQKNTIVRSAAEEENLEDAFLDKSNIVEREKPLNMGK